MSSSKQQCLKELSLKKLQLCPLNYQVYSNVINLDRYNVFLLGLFFVSMQLISASYIAPYSATVDFMATIKDVYIPPYKKPPDKTTYLLDPKAVGFLACSSTLPGTLDSGDFLSESFDSEDQVVVGLDTLASHHLFPSTSDFVSEIPVTPLDIYGVGGNIQAVGQGNMQFRFCCSSGKLHDKILHNAYHAPNVPVQLISIPQLGRDTGEQSYICTGGGAQPTLIWNDSSITLQHSVHAGVPFLRAYTGNNTMRAFYNMCYLAHNDSDSASSIIPPDSALSNSSSVPVNEQCNGTDSPLKASAHDINEHLDAASQSYAQSPA